jgi:ABC-type transport system involved in cytochrome c biogenesis ATPase subunit
MDSMITKPCGGRRLGAPGERPFVGRGPERRLLDGLVESVEGGGAAVLVVGEAGIGKTALLTQVAEMVSHRPGMRVLSLDPPRDFR